MNVFEVMVRLKDDILHVIIGGPRIETGDVKYRRLRFGEYLCNISTTSQVLWVYSKNSSLSNFGRTNTVSLPEAYAERLKCKFTSWEISDIKYIGANWESLQKILLRRLVKTIRDYPAKYKVLWYTLPRYSLLSKLISWDRVVYDCSDYWIGQYEGSSWIDKKLKDRVYRSEFSICNNVDFAFTSSSYLKDWLNKEYGIEAEIIENGVDYINFNRKVLPNDELLKIPSPRLGFVGSMNRYKIDFSLLYEIAKTKKKWSFILIGPLAHVESDIPDFKKLIDLNNVYYLGKKDPSEIPMYMQFLDVGLLPYREADFNLGVFPLKMFEYLAVGLPVVGCGLPSTLNYANSGIYYHTYAKKENFIKACVEALEIDFDREIRKGIAKREDWRNKFEKMYYHLFD